jgi:hypothetical protein
MVGGVYLHVQANNSKDLMCGFLNGFDLALCFAERFSKGEFLKVDLAPPFLKVDFPKVEWKKRT